MKNKFIMISIFFILISFIFISNSSFAVTTYFNYKGVEYTCSIPDYAFDKLVSTEEYKSCKYDYLVCLRAGYIYYYFIDINHDLKLYMNPNKPGNVMLFEQNITLSPDDIILYTMTHSETANDFSKVSSDGTLGGRFFAPDNTLYVYTTLPVYSDINYTTYFFNSPFTLAGSLIDNNPMQIFRNLMHTVLLILLGVIVLILAFRKGWSFLKGEFRKV